LSEGKRRGKTKNKPRKTLNNNARGSLAKKVWGGRKTCANSGGMEGFLAGPSTRPTKKKGADMQATEKNKEEKNRQRTCTTPASPGERRLCLNKITQVDSQNLDACASVWGVLPLTKKRAEMTKRKLRKSSGGKAVLRFPLGGGVQSRTSAKRQGSGE